MAEERMTLIERLRNPQWTHTGVMDAPILDTDRTIADMREAADEIESLRKQFLNGVTAILGKVRENNEIVKNAEARLDRAGL